MTHRIREITDDQCAWFDDDVKAIKLAFDRVFGRHKSFEEDVWLGGDQKADNTEKAPERCSTAMAKLRAARKLLDEADHDVAMFRAVGY